ncbi:2TM domain-containing protein [Aridibaculum aurantiacum]|uniref:2TM domain-containing protein n=1 Tax=Aridibaculum aurantiacum TaxID=2810307 RepID=UPI001A95ADC3|nr:2TM domain-containing protein [Aridibaculum aurantiacum]
MKSKTSTKKNFEKPANLIFIITFLWGVWWFSIDRLYGFNHFPWPLWVMLAWGLGLVFQYFDAYNSSGSSLTQKEYEKLKQEHGQL